MKTRSRGLSPSRSRLAPDSRCASPAAWIGSTRSAPPPSKCSTTRPADSGGTIGRECSPAGAGCSALYGLAAVELLKTRYKNRRYRGCVLLLQPQGTPGAGQDPAPTRAVIAAVLGHLRDVILTGQFTRTPDENNCRYCDYVAACGPRRTCRLNERPPTPGSRPL